MNSNIEVVITDVGVINGRDAIFLDSVEEFFSPHVIKMTGQFNRNLCSDSVGMDQFLRFEIIFREVDLFENQRVDLCSFELELESSFDIVNHSPWLKKYRLGSEYKHYRFATYSYVYQIAAKGFSLILLE